MHSVNKKGILLWILGCSTVIFISFSTFAIYLFIFIVQPLHSFSFPFFLNASHVLFMMYKSSIKTLKFKEERSSTSSSDCFSKPVVSFMAMYKRHYLVDSPLLSLRYSSTSEDSFDPADVCSLPGRNYIICI